MPIGLRNSKASKAWRRTTLGTARVTIIGAGSVRYTLKTVADLGKVPELSGTVVCLMDIDESMLDSVHNLAMRYTKALGAKLRFEATTDMDDSLRGADFVINTALARAEGEEDGYVQYETARAVGERYGYYRGIDSQNFNMGSDYYTLTNFNQLALSLRIAMAVERECPTAWLIQTANPLFEITQLIRRCTNARVVGFCHGYRGVIEVCETLGLDPEKVDWQVAGVNHGIWLTRFLYMRTDAYPLLDHWVKRQASEWESGDAWDLQMCPAAIDMYQFYGRLPIGDTVRNGSWKYNYDLTTKKQWLGGYGGIDNEIERPRFYDELRQKRRKIREVADDQSIDVKEVWPEDFMVGTLSGEQQVPFINAIVNNIKTRLVLNIANRGLLPYLPEDVVVEVPVLVDAEGIHPEGIDPCLPKRIQGMYLMPRIVRMEMALEAFMTGDRKVLEEVLIRDPRTRSYGQARGVIDAILGLPFNGEMRKHYTSDSRSAV